MNIQFKKGVLEICVLSLLSEQDRYGYELADLITHKIDISEGTVYPILRKLKANNYLSTYLQESKDGPPRKYYKLTNDGRSLEKEMKKEWKGFVKKVNIILDEKKNDKKRVSKKA